LSSGRSQGREMNPVLSAQRHAPSKYAGLVPVSIGTILVVAFFAAHQLWSTGFFTSAFGPLETFLFYSSILYGVVTAGSGVLFREDRAIIIQLIGAVLWTITTVWLLYLFPFNFAHVADVVPSPFQFLLSWITQGIGRIIWAIAAIGSAAFVPFFVFQLARARGKIQSSRKQKEVLISS
jgi:hypothetical protein